jgi:elongation factor G
LNPAPTTSSRSKRTTIGKFCSLAFKLWTDPYAGKLVFFRVYSGQLKKGDNIYNPRTRKRERVSRLMVIQGSERKDVDQVYAGDIAALVGLRNITTGDTLVRRGVLTSRSNRRRSRNRSSAWPSSRRRKQDRDKMWAKACSVSPRKTRPSAVSRTRKPASSSSRAWASCIWKSSLTVSSANSKWRPTPARRRSRIAKRSPKHAEGEGKFIRQSGGRGQYGHACITVQPNEKGKGVEVVNEIVGGTIPKEYIPAVIDGIEEAIKSGVYAGYQVIDIKVEVVDGSFHEVDSNELAFKMAGIFALKDAFKKAGPILLEPIMKVECTTPDEYQGDLLGDINRRRGVINSIEAKNGQTVLNAQVPLAEMFGYATAIRSLSKGRASYSMEPLTFQQVPNSVLTTILDAAAKKPAART